MTAVMWLLLAWMTMVILPLKVVAGEADAQITVDADGSTGWVILADVPEGISETWDYVITNTLDETQTYEEGSVGVKLMFEDGGSYDLIQYVHFTAKEAENGITVSLTPAGTAYASYYPGGKIEIRMDTSQSQTGERLQNLALLSYSDDSGNVYESRAKGTSAMISASKALISVSGFLILLSAGVLLLMNRKRSV